MCEGRAQGSGFLSEAVSGKRPRQRKEPQDWGVLPVAGLVLCSCVFFSILNNRLYFLFVGDSI